MAKRKKTPKTTEEAIEALKSGELDKRSNVAKQIIRTRQLICDNPKASLKAIVTNSIAIGCYIQERIAKEMQGRDLINAEGRVDRLIAQDLLSLQRTLLSNCALFGQMEGLLSPRKTKERNDKQAKAKRNQAIANMIIEVSEDVNLD